MEARYDPACEDLAERFIGDPPKHSHILAVDFTMEELAHMRRRLAQEIQDAVEDWFEEIEPELAQRKERLGLTWDDP